MEDFTTAKTMARAAVSAMAQVVQTHPQALRIGAFVASRSQARRPGGAALPAGSLADGSLRQAAR
jgi:hypothetical protein